MRLLLLIGVIIGVFALTNPSEDEYVAWAAQQTQPVDGVERVFFSLIGSPIIRASTKSKSFGLFSLYQTQLDERTSYTDIGFLHHFKPLEAPAAVWQPGVQHPTAPHVIATMVSGKWAPEDGYVWVAARSNNADLRVQWVSGRTSSIHPHVVAADQEQRWLPEDGYAWVIEPPPPGDFRVRWVPGKQSSLHPNVAATENEGRWRPAIGYAWVANPPVDGDFRTRLSAAVTFVGGGKKPERNEVSGEALVDRECLTVSSKQIGMLGARPIYEGHAVCKASACTPDQRIGAHRTCPENGTPIGPWEYVFSPAGTSWRLLGTGNWQAVSKASAQAPTMDWFKLCQDELGHTCTSDEALSFQKHSSDLPTLHGRAVRKCTGADHFKPETPCWFDGNTGRYIADMQGNHRQTTYPNWPSIDETDENASSFPPPSIIHPERDFLYGRR